MYTELAQRIGRQFLAKKEFFNTYNNQLAYEALLLLTPILPEVPQQVAWVIDKLEIGPDTVLEWRNQQFHDLAFPWFTQTQQLEQHRDAFISTTRNWITQAPRRPNRAIIHNCKHDPVGSLLDMLQAYCIRLARAAHISDDKQFATELIDQFKMHREELRNPQSGCYHQGRGWLANDGLSPSPWSRGQGWLLHGMVHCLPLLRAWPEVHQQLCIYTQELLDSLVTFQGPSGLWHQLIDEPHHSFPDSSGSALILEALVLFSIEQQKNFHYGEAIQRAWSALSACVDDEGVVDLACKGPGTIWEVEPWLNTPAPKGDPHGVFSSLFACAAMIRYQKFTGAA